MRKICVFTGTRAEYGLLKPLMKEIQNDNKLELQLIVSGMHLSPEFGLTYKDIEKDGFCIDEKVEILLSADTSTAINKSVGLGVMGFSDVLDRLKPDTTVVLGDRFEALAFAIASYVLRIPIAHIHGGEVTFGAIDEGIRHSITKFSYLHFTSTETYRKRVSQLGEEPKRVFNVGALGIDNIKHLALLTKEEIEKRISKKFKKNNFLITFHPVTLEKDSSEKQFKELLKVLDELDDTLLIFTKSNADTDGRIINKMIDKYVTKNPNKAIVFTNMGELLYLSTMKEVDAVVGNSSSGIIEAPAFKVATINIGDRQKGRIKAKSVINCEPNYIDIKKAFYKLFSEDFQEKIKNIENPYGDGKSAKRIRDILKKINLGDIEKEFYDLNCF